MNRQARRLQMRMTAGRLKRLARKNDVPYVAPTLANIDPKSWIQHEVNLHNPRVTGKPRRWQAERDRRKGKSN